ncbi:MAG: Uma2 family endonuclease [Defluviitaleaceae bacterium]|nr:Uma2 family endonuclease [Defluviitaleaceae bacterium]
MSNITLEHSDFIKELGRELLDGVIVKMAPVGTTHNNVNYGFSDVLRPYFKNSNCKLFAVVYVHLSKKNIFVPDICVVCDPSKIDGEVIRGVQDLIVEIISPSTAITDKSKKKKIYARYGVKEYWIADPKSKSIDVFYLEEGVFELNKTYYSEYSEHDKFILALIEENENAEFTYEITTPLFDGLVVDVREVFKDLP